MESKEHYYIALSAIPKVGPVLAKVLISYCGSVEAIFEETIKNLVKIPGVGLGLAQSIRDQQHLEIAYKQRELCIKKGIELVSFYDDRYPKRLSHYKDAPLLLYTKGQTEFNVARTVAIVGTRDASAYGRAICEKLVSELKEYKVQIISGMAYGIDITAHRSALEHGLSTLGILGHGLDMIYPAVHKNIASKMESQGALVSEFGLGEGPEREHFPMRNRIIAGMSDAVVVIESNRKGGSMITADIAFGYNKDLFAVPGRIGEERSEGCNLLIKSQKAALIQSADDIGYAMMWEKDDKADMPIQRKLFVDLSDIQKSIYGLLSEHKELGVDELSYALKVKGSQLAGDLLDMELQGVIKSLPGNRVRIV